jgi:hypothetical protein
MPLLGRREQEIQWPMRVKALELRAGLGQISMMAQQAGALVQSLTDSDPVTRDILKALFPRAWVGPSGVGLGMGKPDSESKLVAFATGTRLVKSSQVFNPHNSKSSQRMQAKTVCVRAGRCGAAPPVFRLPDGLTYALFLSHFSV